MLEQLSNWDKLEAHLTQDWSCVKISTSAPHYVYEYKQWLYKNVGDRGVDWVIHFTNDDNVFKFKAEKSATLFSLRWS